MSAAAFNQLYGFPPHGEASAPGRVNLIGEFTDYNEGWVLPCALPLQTRVWWRRRDDRTLQVASLNYPGRRDSFNTEAQYVQNGRSWARYVRAVVATLTDAGHACHGVDLLIASDVPQGRGLSSSAALEVALVGALADAHSWDLDHPAIASIGQQAENRYVGTQCGIMDQLVSAAAEDGSALLLDCRSLATLSVPLPKQWALVILDSNHPRELVNSAYNDRRNDCEAACQALGVSSLRDASLAHLAACREALTDNQYARAHHVIQENTRVMDLVHALRAVDLRRTARIMAAGHHSLASDFEVTVEATDTLVKLAKQALGERVAARQTGGGFGGAVVCLCEHGNVEHLLATVARDYQQLTGLTATPFTCVPGGGLRRTRFD